MIFDEFKKNFSESKFMNSNVAKTPIEMDEEIELVYQEETPWIDHLLRVQENFVIFGKYKGDSVQLKFGTPSIGKGLKPIKLKENVKAFSKIVPSNPIDNFTFFLIEFDCDEISVLAISDNSIVNAIESKYNYNEGLALNADDFEQLRLLIKGYNYILKL